MSVTQALKGDPVYCVCIQAAHLNTLVETEFQLAVNVCRKDSITSIADSVELTNKHPYAHVNISEHADVLGMNGFNLVVTDNATKRMYRVNVTPLSPMVVSIPMQIGDPLVLTIQCMYTMEAHRQIVTGMVHTSFMREASIVQTPGSSARKISLSPRRTTTFDQSAAAIGLLGTGHAIPSTKKTLLFLEDAQLNVRNTPNSSIIGGILSAEEIDANGNVITASPIANFHDTYLSEISARVHGESNKHRHVGPASGAYVVCNSKSEMLTSEMNKKTHKKASLQLNLGTLQIAHSTLTGPVKIRAKLVDLTFTTTAPAVDALGNVASGGGKIEQKAVIAYIGMLEEASRELFNETGLIACTLEGKLFKPSSTADAAAASVATAAGTGGEVEETCIAVKLYVSLIPSHGEAPTAEHSDSEESASAKAHSRPQSGHSSTGKRSRKGSHGGGPSHTASTSKLASDSPEHVKSGAKLPQQQGGDPESEHPEADVDSTVQRRLDANQPYNVVTKQNALPDELTGSSSLLAVPPHQSSAAELKAISKSKGHLSVPALPLGGAGSKAASAASLHSHVSGEETRFVANFHTHGDKSGAKSGGDGSVHSSGFLLDRPAPGAFGEALDPAALARAHGKGGQQHSKGTAAAGVAFAEVVRSELERKQKLVDELLEEVKMKTEAIQVCGFDIRQLREEQIRLQNKIQALEVEKVERVAEEQRADAVTSEILKYPNLMQEMDKPALIRNLHKLRDKVNGLDRDKVALEGALRQAKDVLVEFAALKKDHAALQGAHQEQSKYLQKMQHKINQIAAYQETIKTQEKVIAKMQTIVESKMRAKNALPFLPKNVPANALIPVPKDEPLAPPSVPDFEALQAQKANEEALLQARMEVTELTEKVQDLEHQLYEAKLAQYHKEDDQHSDDNDDRSDARSEQSEEEIPNTSEMQELSQEERAKFDDLKAANARIDELEVENTAKGYRIAALEAQLESSTRDYSREIARLRTKLFELEITAAMANDRPSSSAGDDGFMDVDLDALLNIPEPGAPVEPQRPQQPRDPSPAAAGSESPGLRGALKPATPPGGPPTGPVRMALYSRPATGDTNAEQSVDALSPEQTKPVKDDSMGFSATNSRPPSGSARAAALSIKSQSSAAPATKTADLDRKESRQTLKSQVSNSSAQSADIERLAAAAETLAQAERAKSTTLPSKPITPVISPSLSKAERVASPGAVSPKAPSEASLHSMASKHSAPKLAGLAAEAGANEKDSHPGADDGNRRPSIGPEPPALDALKGSHSGAPTPTKAAAASAAGSAPASQASSTTALPSHAPAGHPVAEHPPHEGESLRRVPKFRRKSGDESAAGAPKIGIGPEGPQDPDAIEKTVQLTVEIIDADQVSPRSEATVRTKKDNKIVLAMLSLTVNFHHDHVRRHSTFKILKLKLHGYSEQLLQNRFVPYLKLSVGSKWQCVTNQAKSENMVAQWEFDPTQGFFDKKFVLTDSEIADPSSATLVCVVKKKNERAYEDFECGTGSIVLTKEMFL